MGLRIRISSKAWAAAAAWRISLWGPLVYRMRKATDIHSTNISSLALVAGTALALGLAMSKISEVSCSGGAWSVDANNRRWWPQGSGVDQITMSYHLPSNSDTYKNDYVLTSKMISSPWEKFSVRKDIPFMKTCSVTCFVSGALRIWWDDLAIFPQLAYGRAVLCLWSLCWFMALHPSLPVGNTRPSSSFLVYFSRSSRRSLSNHQFFRKASLDLLDKFQLYSYYLIHGACH